MLKAFSPAAERKYKSLFLLLSQHLLFVLACQQAYAGPITNSSGASNQPRANPEKVAGPAAKAFGEKALRDGQHDFDFAFGTWKTRLWRLLNPLTGSNRWAEYEGTTVVNKVWNGRANLAELEADGTEGHLQVMSLRLHNPQSGQWSLYAASSKNGTLSVPTVGEFKNGRGEFFDQETFNGRTILVRNVWSDITTDSCRFEQAFSDDGGKTWEVNWIAVDTRMKDKFAKGDSPHRWGRVLTSGQFEVLREAKTEPAYKNQYWNNHDKGIYLCAACGNELFGLDTKFESATGWPSFYAPVARDKVTVATDISHGMARDEV